MITLKIIGLIGKAIFAITKTADMKTVRLYEKDKEIEILNKFITDQNAEIERLQDLTVSLDTKCSIAQLTIGQKENEITTLKEEITALKEEITALKEEITALKEKIETSFVTTLESTEESPADEWAGFVPRVTNDGCGCHLLCPSREHRYNPEIYRCHVYNKEMGNGYNDRLPECVEEHGLIPGEQENP